MITVMMGDENHIGFRQFRVVGQPTEGVYMDGLAADRENERTVSDERDLQIAGGSFQDISFE
jgi:hypothetical protein